MCADICHTGVFICACFLCQTCYAVLSRQPDLALCMQHITECIIDALLAHWQRFILTALDDALHGNDVVQADFK